MVHQDEAHDLCRKRGELRPVLVTGTVMSNGSKLHAEWQITVVNLLDKVLLDFGTATSDGIRIG
jgi:hypothetical protein